MTKILKKIVNSLFVTNSHDYNAAARNSWLEQTLAQLPQGARILDAGAGELANKRFCAHLSYTSQDFGKYEGLGNNKGLQTGSWDQSKIDIVCDITDIPLQNASFDAILCSEVFEHLPDPLAALRELCRLLAPKGILILTAPFLSLTHFAPFYYCSGFSPYWYEYHLSRLGLTIMEVYKLGNYTALVDQEVKRVPRVARKYCSQFKLGMLDKIGLKLTLRLLNKMLANDTASSDLACLGVCIRARKLGS